MPGAKAPGWQAKERREREASARGLGGQQEDFPALSGQQQQEAYGCVWVQELNCTYKTSPFMCVSGNRSIHYH